MRYTLEIFKIANKQHIQLWKHFLHGKKEIVAIFYNRTDAQKVCDLLNEVSRSHGKHT